MTFVELYPWLKALHVASAMVFVGGTLAVSVLLTAASGMRLTETVMTRAVLRWDHLVTAPALLLVWALGLTLAIKGGHFSDLWLQLKLVVVVVLSGVHGVQSGRLRRVASGSTLLPYGASPLVLACVVVIVILAAAKPW